MLYSNDDIENLASHIAKMLRYTKDINLEDLLKGSKWKEVNFQGECEGGNLLGDLLLKHATENNNLCVKNLFLSNGFKISQQEQITTEVNEGKTDSNAADSNNSRGSQFATSYNKIKEIITKNPNITAQEFGEELKKEKIDKEIIDQNGWTLLYYAVRSEGPSITGDRSIFLKIVELFTNLNIGIDFKDTASKTVLGMAAVNKQADVVKILLDSDKFDETEKFNALRLAIIQGNIQEAQSFLGRVNNETMQAALGISIDNGQAEITQILLNFITSETPNHNDGIPVVTGADQVVTTPSVEENKLEPSSRNVGNKPAPPTSTEKTDIDSTATPSSNNKGLVDGQFRLPNTQDTKHKESKKHFYASLSNDVVGVVITGLFIASAVMVPSVIGTVVCGVIATLVATGITMHIVNNTLPSYREMEVNEVTGYHSSVRTEITEF